MTGLPPLDHLQPFLVHITEERIAAISVLVLASAAEEAKAMVADWEFDNLDFDLVDNRRTAESIKPNELPGLIGCHGIYDDAMVGDDYFDLKKVVEEYLRSDAFQQRRLAALEANNGQLPLLP